METSNVIGVRLMKNKYKELTIEDGKAYTHPEQILLTIIEMKYAVVSIKGEVTQLIALFQFEDDAQLFIDSI
jgi:hypothetical protein